MGSTVTRSSRASRTWSESEPTEGGADRSTLLRALVAIAGPCIAESAVRVVNNLPEDVQLEPGELERHLLWIARASAGVEQSSFENGATTTLRRRLVDVIREDVVRQWSLSSPEPAEMLDTLVRLERAQKSCAPTFDQSFVAELSERGGLDLVVEVAHDMRSPLTSILFLSEILHRGQTGSFNEVQKRQIGIIYSAALGLVGLASDMIEIAKGGSQLRAPEPVPFSVNEVLRSVHDLVRPTAEEKRLDVNMQMLESEHRLGFPIPLNRVLLNLTTNALKFTHAGAVDLSARSIGGSRVEFSVRDTGPGIPPEAMATLYQPFRREPLRESGYSFSGTGLGLAICRRLVTALGAELAIETRPNWGTRFSFEIDLPPASSFQALPRLM
jgi:signal transduction histidine kinase